MRSFLTVCGASALAVLIFVAGWGIGSGRISLSTIRTLNANIAGPDYDEVNELYKALSANYDGKLTSQQLTEGILKGLASAPGDPYTEYFTAQDAEDFTASLNGTITGIGAQLGKNADGNIEVIAPIDGSPAAAAGLRPRDVIAKVGNDSTAGWSVDEAVTKIRGDKGTKVILTIVRGSDSPFLVTLTRDTITVPSVESEVLTGNIGYIRISQFAESTGTLAQAAAQKMVKAGVKGIILDLRDNGGGYVDAAKVVASLWLPKGTLIYQEKRQDGTVVDTGYASGDNPLLHYKTVVLINGGTASASEIVTGALHDNKAATVIGETSYGKGVVQNVISLSGGAELKVTVASWYRPNGKNINKKGIDPDKTVPLSLDDYKANRDPQKDAAIKTLQ